MKNFWRGAILILLLASTITTFSLFAQEVPQGTITGSKLVSDLLAIVAQNSGSEQSFVAQPNGTSAGFTVFCTSGADMTGATRAMSVDEEFLCANNNIVYREFLLGYDALAIIAHPDLTFLECLTPSHLNTIFATSATNSILDWSQTGVENATATPLAVYLPTDDTSLYALLDEGVNGLGLRTDAVAENDSAIIVDAVKNTAGALGIIPASAVTADLGVRVVSLDNVASENCFAPSSETIERGEYAFASPLYLYINTTAVTKVNEVLAFAFGDEGGASITNAGYVLPTETAFARNRDILTDDTLIGRQFTKEVTAFRIPDNIFGTVIFGGNTALNTTFTSVIGGFTGQYPSVTVTQELAGQNVGIRRYCNDELDFITVATRTADQSAFTPDQQVGCENTIGASVTVDLGKQAVVMVVNGDLRQTTPPAEDAGYNICLTVDQVLRVWGSNPEVPATNWNLIGDNLPDLDLKLIAPTQGQGGLLTDLLLTKIGSAPLIIRDDVSETNDDVTYRATAVSLVPELATYMSWQDYQTASQAEGANLQLVAVDGGNGCVVPSVETITDMTYPYTLNHQLVIKQRALARSEVQGVIWYFFQQENYTSFTSAGIIGRDDLASVREFLQTAFTDAVTASLTPPVETTPEAESTAEATPDVEATTEATPVLEVTVEATMEVTPVVEVTEENTPVIEATMEVTAEATP
ncbi:MAG: substrate-binding domain-containing protein [bacterium]|nr:substrate-binding domain-containing protein [bacterium]